MTSQKKGFLESQIPAATDKTGKKVTAVDIIGMPFQILILMISKFKPFGGSLLSNKF